MSGTSLPDSRSTRWRCSRCRRWVTESLGRVCIECRRIHETHALPYGVQGSPRQLDHALCGRVIALHEDAGQRATCARCQEILADLDRLAIA